MTRTKLDDGYTLIPNVILEELAKVKLNGTQRRILLIVWRMTYGQQKNECTLSNAFLASALGVNARSITREIHRLIERNILIETKKAVGSSPRIIEFNKFYGEWQEWTKTTSQRGSI